MRNYKLIDEWLKKRNIRLRAGFVETLRQYAGEYKEIHSVNLSEIYSMLHCSKQNLSYWEIHCDSTQAQGSILCVIYAAKELFGLTDGETEKLANCAGLSLCREGGNLMETLNYRGKICELCANAMISERMLRHYKKISDKAGAYGNNAFPEYEP